MRLGEVDLRQSIVTRTAANIARLRQGLSVHGLRVRGVVGRDLRRHLEQRLPMERSRVETIADSLHTSQVIVYIELRGDIEPLQRNDRVESNEQIEDGKRREEEPGEKYSDPRRPGEITTSWGVKHQDSASTSSRQSGSCISLAADWLDPRSMLGTADRLPVRAGFAEKS